MSCPLNEDDLTQLEGFINVCKSHPHLLNHPRLSFFKDFIVSLGGTIPTPSFKTDDFTASGDSNATDEKAEKNSSDEESEPESDVELDMEGVIEPDALDDSQIMGDADKETTEEEQDRSDEKRSEAMRAFSEQKYDEAIKLYSEAIVINPASALLFAKRGQAYLKLNKPNACIKDCTRALELNCDSAAAYKFRGRAHRLLGKWEEAAHDLRESCKIDYDEQANEWLAEVTPNAEKLRQHNLSLQRKKEEKVHRHKVRRARRAAAARASAARAASSPSASASASPSAGPAPSPGPAPGAFDPASIASLFADPEIMQAFKDPEVAAALQDVTSNPANILKYQNNPKIAAVLEKLQTKLGKSPGMGGVPGGFPGFGGAAGAGKGAADDDVGLD